VEAYVNTIKEYKEALLVGGKEFGVEVNADKTKCKVISRDRNAERRHNKSIITAPLEGRKRTKTWEQPEQIKILFRKKSRAD